MFLIIFIILTCIKACTCFRAYDVAIKKDWQVAYMMEQSRFEEVRKAHMKTLKLYVPVVERVHGAHHPEFHEVRQLFDSMAAKISAGGRKRPELAAEFQRLREVTHNYQVPGDVCESYEAVYTMLSALDQAWHA